jgi:peptidoglycan LD-endopeptidase LytH
LKPGSKTSKERAVARKRAFVLIASCLCIIFSAVILMNLESPRVKRTGPPVGAPTPVAATEQSPSPIAVAPRDSAAVSTSAAAPIPAGASTINDADVTALSIKNLLIPVAGVASNQLHDSFYDSRSDGRIHEALDIMAPHDMPVLAADDGAVMKLHQSDRGGIMLYQSDPSGLYVYYYGHLSRYADGMAEGKRVKRGEVIGYVGDTGNAGAGNYHLHFGISKMTAAGKWYGGEPINPYPLLNGKPGTPTISGK